MVNIGNESDAPDPSRDALGAASSPEHPGRSCGAQEARQRQGCGPCDGSEACGAPGAQQVPPGVFTTARMRPLRPPSAEAVARAAKLLHDVNDGDANESDAPDPSRDALGAASSPEHPGRSCGAQEARQRQGCGPCDGSEACGAPGAQQVPPGVFTTARMRPLRPPSAEAVARAAKLLHDVSDGDACAPACSAAAPGGAEHVQGVPQVALFTTARMQPLKAPSAEAIEKARKLMRDVDDDADAGVAAAAAAAPGLSAPAQRVAQAALFTTARMQPLKAPSAAAVEKAKKLLLDDGDGGPSAAAPQPGGAPGSPVSAEATPAAPPAGVFVTARFGALRPPSAAAVEKAKKLLLDVDDAGAAADAAAAAGGARPAEEVPRAVAFTTARMRPLRPPSAEALEKARKLLRDDDDTDAAAGAAALPDGAATPAGAGASSAGTAAQVPQAAVFTTARMGALRPPSAAAVEKARKLLSEVEDAAPAPAADAPDAPSLPVPAAALRAARTGAVEARQLAGDDETISAADASAAAAPAGPAEPTRAGDAGPGLSAAADDSNNDAELMDAVLRAEEMHALLQGIDFSQDTYDGPPLAPCTPSAAPAPAAPAAPCAPAPAAPATPVTPVAVALPRTPAATTRRRLGCRRTSLGAPRTTPGPPQTPQQPGATASEGPAGRRLCRTALLRNLAPPKRISFTPTKEQQSLARAPRSPAPADAPGPAAQRGTTLRELAGGTAPRLHTMVDLFREGVLAEVVALNSRTAATFRFRLADLRAQPACGVRSGDGRTIGPEDFLAALRGPLAGAAHECLRGDAWVRNHYRWVLWKLAAYERRFPERLGGRCVTPDRVHAQLAHRYAREVAGAARSALRRVYEHDDAPGRLAVLCVASVRSESALELTDGWYSVEAALDAELARYVRSGRICEGTKLAVFGAELEGEAAPTGPLEPEAARVRLRLHFNGVRRARWWARLGFTRSRAFASRLSCVRAGCGAVPALDVLVLRRYPLLVVETLRDPAGGDGDGDEGAERQRKVVLSQAEHAAAEERRAVVAQAAYEAARARGESEERAMAAAEKATGPPRDVFTSLRLRAVEARSDGRKSMECVLSIRGPEAGVLEGWTEGAFIRVYCLKPPPSQQPQPQRAIMLCSSGSVVWRPLPAPSPRVPDFVPRRAARLAELVVQRPGAELDLCAVVAHVGDVDDADGRSRTLYVTDGSRVLCALRVRAGGSGAFAWTRDPAPGDVVCVANASAGRVDASYGLVCAEAGERSEWSAFRSPHLAAAAGEAQQLCARCPGLVEAAGRRARAICSGEAAPAAALCGPADTVVAGLVPVGVHRVGGVLAGLSWIFVHKSSEALNRQLFFTSRLVMQSEAENEAEKDGEEDRTAENLSYVPAGGIDYVVVGTGTDAWCPRR
eukprot:m51a1_g10328 putative breast cancer type 2 susceptibility protein (1398) ;mRNA; f:80904-88227